MYGDIMEKSVVRQNLKSRNYFKNTLDKLKNLNKTTPVVKKYNA